MQQAGIPGPPANLSSTKTFRPVLATILLALISPASAEAAPAPVVQREFVDVILSASDGADFADVFMQAIIETRIDGSGVTVTRSTQGIMTVCEAQNPCDFHSVNGVRSEEQVSAEPLMNSFSISFEDAGGAVNLTLSEPSHLVAYCVSAGCVSPNLWYTPNTVHASVTANQGYSRGQYMAVEGDIAGIPVLGGGAYANSSVTVYASN